MFGEVNEIKYFITCLFYYGKEIKYIIYFTWIFSKLLGFFFVFFC